MFISFEKYYNDMKIGYLIKEARLRLPKEKRKQGYVCKALGITQSYLSLIENDKREPEMKLIKKIAAFYKIPLPILLWKVIEGKDVMKSKRAAFDEMKPLVDKLINYYFNV